ncbi:MAG: lipopolysaccharide heptosyltransferase II [Desulfobacterales bacterium]
MKILLVQTSFLGDTILSTPVISGLHRAFPDAELWLMTTPQSAELVRRDPLPAGIITFDKRRTEAGIFGLCKMAVRLRSMGFDRAYALHRSYRTAMLLKLACIPVRIGFSDARLHRLYTEVRPRDLKSHDVLRNLSLIAKEIPLPYQNTDLRLFPPDRTEIGSHVRNILDASPNPVVLVPGSVWATKRWHRQGFRDTARHFIRSGYDVLLVGGPEDREVSATIASETGAINMAGETRIDEAMAVLNTARLVICNDSMSMHIACALHVPVVAVFCATTPALGYYPWKNSSIVVEKTGLDCKPCGRHGGRTCPTGTMACIEGVSVEEVIRAGERLLR